MKIYTANNSVEILLNCQELNNLVGVLTNFKEDVEQFKVKNKDTVALGFTHLHLKDYNLIDKNSNADIIFYLNLNE